MITEYLLILTLLTPLVAQKVFSASTPYHLNSDLLLDAVRQSVSPLAVHTVLGDRCGAAQREHGCSRGATMRTLLIHVVGG